MWCSIRSDIAECFIAKQDFDDLPEKLQRQIIDSSSEIDANETSDVRTFVFQNTAIADQCVSLVKKHQKYKESSERRAQLEYELSPGLYKKSDLDEIYKIQEGRCYFSGKPLKNDPNNWSVDHLRPVLSGGSFWPKNLALVLKTINQEKHGRSKEAYWKLLSEKYGADWISQRKVVCKQIDFRRNRIHHSRRKEVVKQLAALERKLCEEFGECNVELHLEGDAPYLWVRSIEVYFPPGFLRSRRCFVDPGYFRSLISELTNFR